MLWVMPAPATAAAPWERMTWNEMGPVPAANPPGARGALRVDQSFWEKETVPEPTPHKQGGSFLLVLAAYLLGASQGEEQVQRCLGEMQVLLHAQAHLQGGKESWQDGEPAGHLQP